MDGASIRLLVFLVLVLVLTGSHGGRSTSCRRQPLDLLRHHFELVATPKLSTYTPASERTNESKRGSWRDEREKGSRGDSDMARSHLQRNIDLHPVHLRLVLLRQLQDCTHPALPLHIFFH